MTVDRGRSRAPKILAALLLLLALTVVAALPAAAAPGLQAGTPVAPSSVGPVAPSTPPPTTGPITPPDAVAGSSVFQANCATCHGVQGNGQGALAGQLSVPPTDFTNPQVISATSLSDIFNVIKNGRMERMMPPWASRLNDQQIWDVAGYVWSLHTSQPQVNAGQKAYAANCASCHGASGKSSQAGTPDLSDFAKTSGRTLNDWLQVIDKGQGTMPGFAGKLQPADQQAVAEYVRVLSFTREFRELTGNGVITGTVTNGTTNQPLASQAVLLHIFDDQGNLVDSREVTTGADGRYRYEGLSTDPTFSFIASTQYPSDTPNSSAQAAFQSGQTTLGLPLTVYEPTTDPTGISIDRVHFIITFGGGPGQLQIGELIVFSKTGNRTYMGDGKGVLNFTLPQGAVVRDVNGEALGQRFQQTANGFTDTTPLAPGTGVRQVLVTYSLPYSGDTLDFTRTLPYTAANVNALVQDGGEQVSSATLTSQGSQSTGMGNFINLTGTNLPANQPVTLHFTGLSNIQVADASAAGSDANATPTSAQPGGLPAWLLLIIVALVGVGAGLLAAWPMLRQRTAVAGGAAGGAAPGGSETPTRAALVDELARLDLAHDTGEIGDAAYREQRLRLKAQLLDMLRQEHVQ